MKDRQYNYLNVELEMAVKEPPARIIGQKSDYCKTSVRNDHSILFRCFIQLTCDVTYTNRRKQVDLQQRKIILFSSSIRSVQESWAASYK